MKIAFVHEYLVKKGGAERVLQRFLKVYPRADLFCIVYDQKVAKSLIGNRKIYASFLQKIPFAVSKYQLFLWLMPKAVENCDFSGYDIVFTSSHSFAKWININHQTKHICYCHTPTRYLWLDQKEHISRSQYFGPLKWLMPKILKKFKKIDFEKAQKVDLFLANSKNVQKRIKKFYKRDSQVLYPPVNCEFYKWQKLPRENFYLFVSRLEPHKNPDLAVEAFNKLRLPLKIVGAGTMDAELKKNARKNIEFLGEVSDKKLRELYNTCQALIFPQEEDFGIVPVEAQSCGSPVIAFARGGALETIENNKTGLFFEKQNKESLISAVQTFQKENFDSKYISTWAKKFDEKKFEEGLKRIIQ